MSWSGIDVMREMILEMVVEADSGDVRVDDVIGMLLARCDEHLMMIEYALDSLVCDDFVRITVDGYVCLRHERRDAFLNRSWWERAVDAGLADAEMSELEILRWTRRTRNERVRRAYRQLRSGVEARDHH